MFCNNILKNIACIILITYCSTVGVDLAWATDQDLYNLTWTTDQDFYNPPLLALGFTDQTTKQENELRKQQIYKNKAQRIEDEINKMEGKQQLLVDVMVSSAFAGAGLIVGSQKMEKTINDIELEPGNTRGEKDKENALNAFQSVEQIGWGVAGVSVLSTIGWATYWTIIRQKQRKKEDYLNLSNEQYSETDKAIESEIEELKKAQRTRTSYQHIFSSVAIGSLITGGLLWGTSGPLRDNMRDIEINDNDFVGQQYKDEALETAEEIENVGKGLVIAGAVFEVASIIAGRLAKNKEGELDKLELENLEKGELTANHHFNINPQPGGFVFLYSYNY